MEQIVIDWVAVREGDAEEIEKALLRVEGLWHYVLDHKAPGWRRVVWDMQEIEQEMRLKLLTSIRRYDPAVGSWETYAVGVAEKYAVNVRMRMALPGAETHGKARPGAERYGLDKSPMSLSSPSIAGRDDVDTVGDRIPAPDTDWEGDIHTQMDWQELLKAAQLTKQQTLALYVRVIEPMGLAEAEAKYGITSKQQDNGLQNAKRRLRETAERLGWAAGL